jgi:type IV pilus assembly protein PilW
MRFYSRPNLGFTLVELMVTLTMGLFLAFGLIRVYTSSNDSYYALSQAAEQIENGRHAIETLKKDLMHAGYYGEYAFAPAAGTALPDPCLTSSADLRDALSFHIQGYNAPAASPITCIDNNNHLNGTDMLVVRRVSTVATALGALTANDMYMQATAESTNAANPILNVGNPSTVFTLKKKDGVTLADVRKYMVRIYYVSPCSVPASGTVCGADADGGRPVPTLKRLDLAVNTATNVLEMRTETVAEGIENLQVDYGVDTDGDGLADANFLSTPAAVANWGDVVSAQVNVLARNVKLSPGYTDTKTYDLGTAGTVTPGGNFRRHAFSAQVRLVNPAGRREVP